MGTPDTRDEIDQGSCEFELGDIGTLNRAPEMLLSDKV